MGLSSNVELSDLKKYKNKVLDIFVIILAVIISMNIYKKQLSEISSLNQQKELESKKNSEFENIGKLEKKDKYLKNYLKKADLGSSINSIADIAKDLNVKIVSIRPETVEKFQQYAKQPFSLSLVFPGYHELGRFVSMIENSAGLYTIDNIDVRLENKGTSLSVNLRLSSVVVN